MKKEVKKSKDKVEDSNFKKFIIPMVILDIVGIANLAFEIYLKEILYISYIILVLCNIIVFGINILKIKAK